MAFKKYGKLRRPGHSDTDGLFDHDEQTLIITEKLDGNNYRVQRDGDKLRFGSRNVDLGTDVDDIGGMFEQVTGYLDENVDPDDLRELEELWAATREPCESATITLFGENAVQHQISEYEWQAMPQFNLFDVHVECDSDVSGEWLRWDLTDEEREQHREEYDVIDDEASTSFFTVCDVAEVLGIETAPLVDWTTVGEFLDGTDPSEWDVPESFYRTDGGQAEGVVLRNPTTGVKAKRISDDFAERKSNNHGSGGGGGDQDERSDHEKFLDAHATNNRIEKNIGKLIEAPDTEYDSVEMEMMQDLHLVVWRDVWAEDYEEIISNRWTLDLDNLHNEVANKCATRLRKLLQSGEVPVSVVEPTTGTVADELLGELND